MLISIFKFTNNGPRSFEHIIKFYYIIVILKYYLYLEKIVTRCSFIC